jgi:hypothetical protein
VDVLVDDGMGEQVTGHVPVGADDGDVPGRFPREEDRIVGQFGEDGKH